MSTLPSDKAGRFEASQNGCKQMTNTFRATCALLALVILVGMGAREDARAAEPIIIGTASPGGPYLAYGQGLARILSRELGFPMYDTAFQFVAAKRLHLHWLEDLAGLRIGAGPRAATAGVYLPMIFKALDIKANVRFGAWESMTSQLRSGDLDGIVFGTGFPTPALTQLIAAEPVDFVPPSADQVALIRKALPEISRSTVPAQTYPTQERDYATIGLFNFAVAHKDLPDDVVYKIVKTVFDNREELMKAQSSAKETVPANIGRDELLPLHPGAARYYREIGVPIAVQQTQ
jgi:uncharacterized protein